MERQSLRDDQWDRIKNLLPGRDNTVGITAKDNRLFMEAVLWVARTGTAWRDLPPHYGKWNSVFQRYNRWLKSGVFMWVFRMLADDPSFEFRLVNSTIIYSPRRKTATAAAIRRRKPSSGPPATSH